ncbi:hypothetical protein Tco_0876231 [Tanacetum coccineum]|uniref:Reverse transcriptase Ty1/copia-type domain-containing protein n=1 Tax=Tanacetum coccineum TaxID=301880 RepID=A0ABQ5BRU9_9ASTR
MIATNLVLSLWICSKEEFNFEEAFAPVARKKCTFGHCDAAHNHLHVPKDVKTAFLYGPSEGRSDVNQPDGFSSLDMSMMGERNSFRNFKSPPSPRGIFINQAKYAQEILKKHGMTSCDSIGTPMATKHLDANLSGTPVDQTKYRSMVGALMYLTASRPDIVHATCYCARYQAKPTEKHLIHSG